MQKKSFLTPLGFVRQYNSPKPYCSPSVIIQGNFHLYKHPNERFDRFFTTFRNTVSLITTLIIRLGLLADKSTRNFFVFGSIRYNPPPSPLD